MKKVWPQLLCLAMLLSLASPSAFAAAPENSSVPVPAPASSLPSVPLAPAALTATKAVSAATAIPGSSLVYTVTVENTGTTSSTVTLTDTLHSGLTFVSATPGATYSSTLGAVLWGTTLNAGVTGTLVLTTSVNSGVASGTSITNTARVRDGATGNVVTTNEVSTTVNAVNLSTSRKTVNRTTAAPGDVLTYTLTVSNSGTSPATNALVTDTLPANTSFITATNGTYSSTQNAVLFNGPLGIGAEHVITFSVRVASPLARGTVIRNSAQLNSGTGQTWSTNTVSTTIESADVFVVKSVDNSNPVPGSTVTYTLLLYNLGTAGASTVLTDVLPSGATVRNAEVVFGPAGSTVVTSTHGLTYTGTLDTAANSVARISYTAEVTGTSGQVLTNTATVNDGQGMTRTASAAVTLQFTGSNRVYLPFVAR